jgi:hypothetical protein
MEIILDFLSRFNAILKVLKREAEVVRVMRYGKD